MLRSIKALDKLYRVLKSTSFSSNEYNYRKNELKLKNATLHKCIRAAKINYFFSSFQKY